MKLTNLKTKTLLFLSLFILFLSLLPASQISAQIQATPFSGNDPASYQCYKDDGSVVNDPTNGNPAPAKADPNNPGRFICTVDETVIENGKTVTKQVTYQAYLKPPTLQALEVWFVRILYAIWALVASLSFLFLVKLGYQYLLRGGTSDEELVKLRKNVINYIIGFALVFLAVPILSTFFRLLGINKQADCYNVNMPAFQFFFTNLCTDPNRSIVGDPCNISNALSGAAVGKACNTPGEIHSCTPLFCYYCKKPDPNHPSSFDYTWREGTLGQCI